MASSERWTPRAQYLFSEQKLAGASPKGSHMAPAGVMAQHLHVNEAHKDLLDMALINTWVFHMRLEDLHLPANNCVLLGFAFAVADGPHQCVELT